MSKQISKNNKHGWTTRDIMVTAIISIALGVVYVPLTYLAGWMEAIPYLSIISTGVYFWPIIMVAYLIRKPGTALLSACIIFLIQVPLTPWGVLMMVFVLTIGMPIEFIFLISRYKNFKLWNIIFTGSFTGLITVLFRFIVHGWGNMTPLIQLSFIIAAIFSGGLIGGGLAKLIGDAVIKTGIIPLKD